VTLIDRYVGLTIIRYFAYALAGLLAVFAVINLSEQLRSTADQGWGVARAIWFVVLTLPNEAYTLFPAAALLGTVLGLGHLASDHELVALQAAGVSPLRLALAALLAGGAIAITGATFAETLGAPLNQRANSQRALALSGGHALSTSSGLWLRDGSRFVDVGTLRSDGSLGELYLFDFADGRKLARFAHARAATRVEGRWQLQELSESTFHDEASTSRSVDAAPWDTSIDPRQIQTLWLEPRDLSLVDLGRTIQRLRAQHQNPLAYEVAFWRRVSAPVYTEVMILLAMPMVMVSGRAVRVGERALLGALVGLGFQMFQEMFTSLGLILALPPLVIAFGPAVVVGGVVSVLVSRRKP
jgi:lipopolysaccharide export system permease protein